MIIQLGWWILPFVVLPFLLYRPWSLPAEYVIAVGWLFMAAARWLWKKATIDEYQRGALTAISVLISTHDDIVAAADVLIEMGMAEINLADLDQWDKDNLRKLQGERGGAIKLRNLGTKLSWKNAESYVQPSAPEMVMYSFDVALKAGQIINMNACTDELYSEGLY